MQRLPLSTAAARRAGLAPLREIASTGSTNDDLVAEARRGLTGACVLVAEHQTAGRGRLGRRWIDAGRPGGRAGSLLASFRFPGPMDGAADRVAAVSAAALSAAAAALAAASEAAVRSGGAAAAAGAAVLSKWPNDLVIESPSMSGKLAGVLAETVAGHRPATVVGLGLNLSPAPGEPGAVALSEMGAGIGRDELLAGLLDALPAYLADPARARADLHAASATAGRRVRVELAGGAAFEGVARAVDRRGRLVVDTDAGPRVVEAGDVHHLRPDLPARRP